MGKCAYCGSADVENKVKVNTWSGVGRQDVEFEYCSAACKQEIEAFSSYVNRNAAKFLTGIGVLVMAMVLGGGLFPRFGLFIVGGASFLMGLLIVVFPFATPQTNRMMGIRNAVKTARVLGGMVSVMGLLAFWLGINNL
ncbi:MAG: hypothetical protein ACM3QZ_01075 [Solirubrobacterales bacterium]